jgi:hypothetical protein
MKTLTVNIEDSLSEKAITSILDALKLEYEIDDITPFEDETARIMTNPYLYEKVLQGRMDLEADKGTRMSLTDLFK